MFQWNEDRRLRKKVSDTCDGGNSFWNKQRCVWVNDAAVLLEKECAAKDESTAAPSSTSPLRSGFNTSSCLLPEDAARAAKVRRALPFTIRARVCVCEREVWGVWKSKHRPRHVCLCNSCCGYSNSDGNSGALCAFVHVFCVHVCAYADNDIRLSTAIIL